MKNLSHSIRQDEQGFTLVELAVVMIIIGILIGGILKGQELITNARVTSTISQMEALSAAKNDFQNQYNALPGDMSDAVARIATCGAAACDDGDGDGILDDGVGAAAAAGNENVEFFRMLLGAGYITGMDGQASNNFGEGLPTAPVGGGYNVGDTRSGVTNFTEGNMRPGVYLVQVGSNAAVGASTGIMTGLQASRIDTKLDDGIPDTGGVHGDTQECLVAGAGAAPATYAADADVTCSVAYRI